jgi:hypothetical protein
MRSLVFASQLAKNTVIVLEQRSGILDLEMIRFTDYHVIGGSDGKCIIGVENWTTIGIFPFIICILLFPATWNSHNAVKPIGYLDTLSVHRSIASGVYTIWQMKRKDYRHKVISVRGTMRLSDVRRSWMSAIR